MPEKRHLRKNAVEITMDMQQPDLPDLVRLIVAQLIRSGIDYEDGGVILIDLYQDAFADAEAALGSVH